MSMFAKEAHLEHRILSAKFLGFFAAIMLAPGLGGCDAATAQELEGQLLTPDNAGLAVDAVDAVDEESAPAAAFSMPAAADSAALSSSCDGQEIVSSSFSNAGSASLGGNAFATGVSGTYQGTAAAKVIYPPGSWPGSGALRAQSPRVPIDFP